MPSFAHKKLVERIGQLDDPPADPAEFSVWIQAEEHLAFLRENARADELVIYALGSSTFLRTMVVPNERLSPVDQDDLLRWNFNPDISIASYVSEGGRDDIQIERNTHGTDSKTLDAGMQLIFGRTFEGWTGDDRRYFEILQEYAHLAGIHWRPEHRSYCRFDENGDVEHVVSVTTQQTTQDGVAAASFAWGPMEHYLAASNTSLVRLFDFTLFRRGDFSGWPQGPEDINRDPDLFYRQKVVPGRAAYTRGVQILRPRRPARAIFADMRDAWSGRRGKRYIGFLAHDLAKWASGGDLDRSFCNGELLQCKRQRFAF